MLAAISFYLTPCLSVLAASSFYLTPAPERHTTTIPLSLKGEGRSEGEVGRSPVR